MMCPNRGVRADSPDREASYLTAAKFLPPVLDYMVLGDVRAPVKAQMSMDGKLMRSDGNVQEPAPPNGTSAAKEGVGLACISSEECNTPPRDRSYCYRGECVAGGGVVFDGAAFLGFSSDPTQQGFDGFPEQQMGTIGGHLRVVRHFSAQFPPF